MSRLMEFIQSSRFLKDRFALGLLGTVGLIATWLIAMPVCPAIQRWTIDRFHLATPSFALWMLQQPIPPMYNLENRYWFSQRPLSDAELTTHPPPGVETAMLNHFPARAVTFAAGRLATVKHQREAWLYLRSRYRDSQRITAYHLTPVPGSPALRMLPVRQAEIDQASGDPTAIDATEHEIDERLP